ncbi:MAG: single-stranded DNA-binding protein [Mycobacteriales bacterium]
MEIDARNEVVLVGRLAGEPQARELPSGDLLATWRLVVDRPPPRRKPPAGVRSPTVDTLDCVAWTSSVRRAAAGWQPGDLVAVEGSLRRRFWRTPVGASSRYEVEVTTAKRLARAS